MNKFILTTLGKIMFNKILPNSFIDFLDNLEEEIKKIEINNIEKE